LPFGGGVVSALTGSPALPFAPSPASKTDDLNTTPDEFSTTAAIELSPGFVPLGALTWMF
jgi:hypothetical protein